MPDGVRGALHDALAPYREAHDGVRWLDPASWHVTLVFLGSVPVAALPDLVSSADRVAARWPATQLDIVGGGGRVQRGDGVAWLAVQRSARIVIDLADDLDREVRDIPGIPHPRRAPSAHLTVARRADAGLIAALRDEALGPVRASWGASHVAIMRSHLGPAGARYERIHEALLSGTTRG